MITANEGGRHKAYAEMLGVADYLRKPFAMDVMLESVSKALASAAAKRPPAIGAAQFPFGFGVVVAFDPRTGIEVAVATVKPEDALLLRPGRLDGLAGQEDFLGGGKVCVGRVEFGWREFGFGAYH